jgi:hypothetical protein
MFVLFEHDRPGSVAHDKTIAVYIVGTTCSLGIIIAGRHGPCGAKSGHS